MNNKNKPREKLEDRLNELTDKSVKNLLNLNWGDKYFPFNLYFDNEARELEYELRYEGYDLDVTGTNIRQILAESLRKKMTLNYIDVFNIRDRNLYCSLVFLATHIRRPCPLTKKEVPPYEYVSAISQLHLPLSSGHLVDAVAADKYLSYYPEKIFPEIPIVNSIDRERIIEASNSLQMMTYEGAKMGGKTMTLVGTVFFILGFLNPLFFIGVPLSLVVGAVAGYLIEKLTIYQAKKISHQVAIDVGKDAPLQPKVIISMKELTPPLSKLSTNAVIRSSLSRSPVDPELKVSEDKKEQLSNRRERRLLPSDKRLTLSGIAFYSSGSGMTPEIKTRNATPASSPPSSSP